MSVSDKSLYYKLNIIFGLFFLLPVFSFFYFALKYEILSDRYVPLFFIAFLIFSFAGFVLLRKIFDEITRISDSLYDTVDSQFLAVTAEKEEDELRNIAQSFAAIGAQFKATFGQLERKMSEVSVLKELSDLCYVTFDQEELLYVTLERSLKLANANIGSVLILERPRKDAFIVKATIGLGDIVQIGDRIDFSTSIAKYAVINKSNLVVENIETDTRFGRENRPHYATKSFICMPIKTIKDIVGVVTISRKDDEKPLTQEDVEALTPLLSNAAFTYENLRLLKEREEEAVRLSSMEKALKVINSSYKESELLQALLNETRLLVPFELAVIMTRDERKPGHLVVFDFLAGSKNILLSKGTSYPYKSHLIDQVLRQESIVIVDQMETFPIEMDNSIFTDRTSCLFAPLKMRGTVIGILALCSPSPEAFYELKRFIESMADAIALSIEKDKLSSSFAKKNQEMETLKRIGSFLTYSTFDISKVLNYTMDMIKVTMNVEAGSLLLLKDDELEFTVAFNIDVNVLKNYRLKHGQGIAGYVAARGEPVIVNDVKDSPHFYGEVDKTTGFKTRSALCVPIISQGRVIGVIEVLNKISGDFDLDDQQLLQSIASSVTIALENARLYKETVSMAEHERDIRQVFQKFVPEEVVNKIIYGSEAGERREIEEQKMLTLINIDIRGFSEMAQDAGPRKTVAVLNHFFSVMGEIVFKYKGIVDKYLGDGFLAIFGAPVSSENDTDNAILAALEMKEAITAVNKYCLDAFGVKLGMGISINTGEVVVGNIGFDKKMDYTVIGDPVNAVFRLQYLTKSIPNCILISEYTLAATTLPLNVREIQGAFDRGSAGVQKVYELMDVREIEDAMEQEDVQSPPA